MNQRVNNQNKVNHSVNNQKQKYEKFLNKRSLLGIFQAEVVNVKDLSRTGRMQVFVAALDGSRANTGSYITCKWSSPFAGTTDTEGVGTDVKDYVCLLYTSDAADE